MGGRDVDAVVFDLGGVLLDWSPRYLYGQLFDDPDEMSDFFARICTSDWHRAHDLGADTTQSCERLARQHPRYADLIMAWAYRGEEMIRGQIDGTVEILAELRRPRGCRASRSATWSRTGTWCGGTASRSCAGSTAR